MRELDFTIRRANAQDAPGCGPICFAAFEAISSAHNFPCDFPGPEVCTHVLSGLFAHPKHYSVVAEDKGKLLGSNCLDERSMIAGVGPITVDPGIQNRGVGRGLMQAVLERADEVGAPGVRLVQAGYHNRSLSLYASLGFDIREPLSCMQGRTLQRLIPGCEVRPAQSADVPQCSQLSREIHGFDRAVELVESIERGNAKVVERGGRITGYTTGLAFFNHSTAETNTDLQALIASAETFGGPGILVPTRNSALFRWCLANGLRVVQPLTLMTMGLYNDPAGAWLPSVIF